MFVSWCSQLITAEHHKITHDQLTSSPEEDYSMQLKHRDLHHKWLHRETNEKLSFYWNNCFLRQTQLNLTNLEYLSETWNNLTQSNQGSETKFRKLINHSQQLHCTTAPCSYHEQTQSGTNWEAQSRRYLLMLLPSLSLSPSAPLLLALSLPAKSTRLSLLTFSPMDCKTSKLC